MKKKFNATHVGVSDNSCGTWFSFVKAFTLAEVLITIAIIGVVAAITIPILFRNVNERVNSAREANIAQKITQAMDKMNALGELEYFQTTEDFVNALKKHLKISKICTNDKIEECWPTKTIRTSSGSNYEVKNAKLGTDLHTGNRTNNVGIILADGASIILTYNPNIGTKAGENVKAFTKRLPVGFGKFQDYAYSSTVTNGIDFVMDVNGASAPNAETTDNGEYNDIRSFRVASFSNSGCQGTVINGVCVVNLGTSYSSINCANGNNPEFCTLKNYNLSAFDFQAGARKACYDLGMRLPSSSELINLLKIAGDNYSDGKYILGGTNCTNMCFVGCVNKPNYSDFCGTSAETQLPAICISN